MIGTAFTTLDFHTLTHLEVPPLEWIVDGILPAGSLTLLAAREKAGKSILTTDLCCSVAAGEPFLDRAVRQGPALLVVAEENVRDVQQRILQRANGRTDLDLHVLFVNGFDEQRLRIDLPESLDQLLATIQQLQPVVVVLDPMRELHWLAENESDSMSPLLRPVREIAHQTNAALVLNHHMSKAGVSRGSTAIKAACDQEWAFKRNDDETSWEEAPTEGVLRVDGRFGPKLHLGIRLGEHMHWQPVSLADLNKDASAQGRLVLLLQEHPEGMTTDEIAEGLGISRKTVQNMTADMLRDHAPRIVSTGRGVTNDPRKFKAANPLLFDDEWTTPDCPGTTQGTTGTSPNGHYPPAGSGIYVCLGCGLPRAQDRTPCPNCGRTEGREA